ncbi:MAG: hypothetical protein DMF83_06875 [Acidobacteria bacterium]|nr:MAG: hypothetical protein DMF83_06875 [Acidobacteriota bacterium]
MASFNVLDPGRALRKIVFSSARTSTGAPGSVLTVRRREERSRAVTSPMTESALRGASEPEAWMAGAGLTRSAAINHVFM